jgi:hypothetical protein
LERWRRRRKAAVAAKESGRVGAREIITLTERD